MVALYDVVLNLDDDLKAETFDPPEFVAIQRNNFAEVAAPTLSVGSGSAYQVDFQVATNDGLQGRPVGRFTNFVEVCAKSDFVAPLDLP